MLLNRLLRALITHHILFFIVLLASKLVVGEEAALVCPCTVVVDVVVAVRNVLHASQVLKSHHKIHLSASFSRSRRICFSITQSHRL